MDLAAALLWGSILSICLARGGADARIAIRRTLVAAALFVAAAVVLLVQVAWLPG